MINGDYVKKELAISLHDFEQEVRNLQQVGSLNLEKIDVNLSILSGEFFFLKLYDKAGHGYSFSVNITKRYSAEWYCSDEVSLHHLLMYLHITPDYSFESRMRQNYVESIPKLLNTLQTVVERIIAQGPTFWDLFSDFVKSTRK